MPGNDRPLAKVLKHLKDFFFGLRTPDHLISNAGQVGRLFGERETGINKLIKACQDFTVLHLDRGQLNHLIVDCGQPGCFHVKNDVSIIL